MTKLDLWWKKRKEVDLWLRQGEYGQIVDSLREKASFRHELVCACLGIRNLQTGDKELLVETAAGYDQVEQVASVKRLVDAMESLWKWEQQA